MSSKSSEVVIVNGTETSPVENADTSNFAGVFPIVGIGASAGGLEALRRLLSALPPDTGMGFVIVQHLSPHHESSLTEILARETRMPVAEVKDEPEVKADHVYVIPPGRDMIIEGGRLRLLQQERGAHHRGIDQFFRSLAEDRQHKAIGVVLSGAASDGTLGVEEIKGVGGMTFAQDGSALHDSMPLSAVASGCVDFVLSPEDIAAELDRIAKHPYVAPAEQNEEQMLPGSERARINQIVLRGTGMDFTYYKANTMQRRIARRMLMHKLDTGREYVDRLRQDPAEVQALYQDLLIGVTRFFRNADAFDALAAQVLPKLLKEHKRDDPVRIWVLGCSTGEEAYSLAMAFTEHAEAARSHVRLQIFATDPNSASIDKARTGLYPRSIEEDVSSARLTRFFVEEERGYRISRAIRERCIFSRHNALTDPPFSRLDLVSCRNMLIYLEPVLQQRIMPMLHYALKPDGFLWLGSSETVGSYRTLFELDDVRQKIFVRLPGQPVPRRVISVQGQRENNVFAPATPPPREAEQPALQRSVERLLLAKYAPPAVVITETLEIIQFSGDTGAYLAPAVGAPSQSLLKMLREGLVVGVRAAVKRAIKDKAVARETGLRVRSSEGFRVVTVEVMPLTLKSGIAGKEAYVVLFDDGARPMRNEPALLPPPTGSEAEEIVRLTHELASTREYLESVIEQQEAANEELQSSNEEAQSANEEMQSVNEELETTKEEIQSSNEELCTINEELSNRTHEMQVARDYAESIVESVRVPLLVLTGELRVRSASRAFYEFFNVTPEITLSRRVYELGNGQWNLPELRTLLEELLPRHTVLDHYEVSHTFDSIGLRHMLLSGCRLAQSSLNEPLILLSLTDITDRKHAADALVTSEQRFRLLVDAIPQLVWIAQADGTVFWYNHRWYDYTGTTLEEMAERGWQNVHDPVQFPLVLERWGHALASGQPFDMTFPLRGADGTYRPFLTRMIPLRDNTGQILQWFGTSTDVGELKRVEDVLADRVSDLAKADRSKDEFLAMLAHELRNPLAPLRNAAAILQADQVSTEEQDEAKHMISRQIGNMSRMIDDLLDVSRITEGKIDLRIKPVPLEPILMAAASGLRSTCEANRQELSVKMPKEPVYLEADATRLEQVFCNLLANACKYGGKGCHITLSGQNGGEAEAPEVVITVKDDGIGIAPELLPRVFDLFVQSSRTLDRMHGGLGIGLTLVKRLVHLHHGTVEARSGGLGRGAEFIVHLPVLREAPAPPTAPAIPVPCELPRRILIVDDNSDSARSLATLQRRRGHNTLAAFTGPDALTAAAAFLPEVVLLDIGLPGMDGFEVARKLRAMPQLAGVVIIAMSGYGSAHDRSTATEAGFDEYMVKPIDLQQLSQSLRLLTVQGPTIPFMQTSPPTTSTGAAGLA